MRKILFLVTEDWYFVSHRLSLASAARLAGYDVAVATRVTSHADHILRSGIRLIPLNIKRRGGNVIIDILSLIRLYKKERPDIVHHVALKPVFLGSFAALLTGVPSQVNAISGLGWLFTTSNIAIRLIRPLLRHVLSFFLNRRNNIVILQNSDDRHMLEKSGVRSKRIRIIEGSGVDLIKFHSVVPSPPPPVMIVLVGRMLADKGVMEFAEASRIINKAKLFARFILVGEPDPSNPTSLSENILTELNSLYGLEWWGRRDDISEILHSAHIACLPSYREGMPKSLLEAAACGLPIVTTDAPGCREVVSDGVNGFLVPVGSSVELAGALRKLIFNEKLRKKMGRQSRLVAEQRFGQEKVFSQTLDIYQELSR